MADDGTSPGILSPQGIPPLYDEGLEVLLRRWLAQASEVAESHIFVRWSTETETLPTALETCCGFSITGIELDATPSWAQDNENHGTLCRHELMTCVCSFYGAASQAVTMAFLDSLCVEQNHQVLKSRGLALVSHSPIAAFPEKIDEQWVRRHDVTLRLHRKITRHYGIQSLLETPLTFFGE